MTEAEILARMQERVASSAYLGDPTAPLLRETTSDGLNGAVNAVRVAGSSIGALNPRDPGLISDLIQKGKRIIQRSLSWYTRALHQFASAVANALQSHTIAIQQLTYSVDRISDRVEQLASGTQENIPQAPQSWESDLNAIGGTIRRAGVAAPPNQEELLQLKRRLENELSMVRKEAELQRLQLREIRQELEGLRGARD